MAEIEFDRDAVGVHAKSTWYDSEEFAQIGNAVAQVSYNSIAEPLPTGDNSGVTALQTGLASFCEFMSWVALEYSDACAVLGSGEEEAISNYDHAETTTSEAFESVRARLDG